jgi:ubiquitin carboxyl-terminal hydrolase 36/42
MPGGGSDGTGAGGALGGLDFSAVIQAALVGLVLFAAAVTAVRRAASRYFVVDASGFAAAYDDHHHHHLGHPEYAMPPQEGSSRQLPLPPRQPRQAVSPGQEAELGPCAQCGGTSTKKCSRCKRVRYWCVPPLPLFLLGVSPRRCA